MNQQNRQIGYGETAALRNLEQVVREWVVPFLEGWINTGPQPVPGPEDIREIETLVQELSRSHPLPEGYAWLPKFLEKMAASTRFNARNFVNIHPTPHLPAVVAGLVASIQNPNNIVEEVSKTTTSLEQDAVRWMAEHLVGFDPDKAWGNVVSGGTIANMTALLVARDYSYRKLARPRPSDVRTRGLYGLPAGVVLATAGSHYSVKKALWFLGMGDENVVRIPVAYDEAVHRRQISDANFVEGITNKEWKETIGGSVAEDRKRGEQELAAFYRGDQCPFSLQPLNSEIFKALYSCFEYNTPLVGYVFTLGTTDTGTIEAPNDEAIKTLVKENVFIHADAALGGFALPHKRLAGLVKGLSRVHSVTIDGHKLGQLAYPNGAILFRDVAWRQEIMHEAPYLRGLAPTLEGSRTGASSASLWAAIQDLGKTSGYHGILDRLFAFVDRLKELIATDGTFQVLHHVQLTTLAVAPVPRGGETRTQVNRIVGEMRSRIEKDRDHEAFLINIDDGLSEIKVRDSNRFIRFDHEGESDDDRLVDIRCLRLVVSNPGVAPGDAGLLLHYLLKTLREVRG